MQKIGLYITLCVSLVFLTDCKPKEFDNLMVEKQYEPNYMFYVDGNDKVKYCLNTYNGGSEYWGVEKIKPFITKNERQQRTNTPVYSDVHPFFTESTIVNTSEKIKNIIFTTVYDSTYNSSFYVCNQATSACTRNIWGNNDGPYNYETVEFDTNFYYNQNYLNFYQYETNSDYGEQQVYFLKHLDDGGSVNSYLDLDLEMKTNSEDNLFVGTYQLNTLSSSDTSFSIKKLSIRYPTSYDFRLNHPYTFETKTFDVGDITKGEIRVRKHNDEESEVALLEIHLVMNDGGQFFMDYLGDF